MLYDGNDGQIHDGSSLFKDEQYPPFKQSW